MTGMAMTGPMRGPVLDAPIPQAVMMPFSEEIGAPGYGEPVAEPAPLPEQPLVPGTPQERDPQIDAALAALYGASFPLLANEQPTKEQWADWVRERWGHHAPGQRSVLHLVERNRLFRGDVQWIDSQRGAAWKEPPKPKDAARIVQNMIAPALDLRVQIVSEQRPGIRTKPATQDPDDLKKAEAQQIALDYQYDQQHMEATTRELEYWCGTDGVCFLEKFWNPEKGPWDEVGGQQMPLGDIDHRVRRIEQVRVSAEASSTRCPWYWIIKDVMPKAQAVREYGPAVADASATGEDENTHLIPSVVMGYDQPHPDDLLTSQETVDRFTMYCERSEYLPQGLHLICVGGVLVRGPIPLIAGIVPMVRYTDGSTDPSFFCKATMNQWVATQMRINAILSKWVENIRLNAGPKLLAKENAVVGETLIGGTLSVIGVKGLDDLNSAVRALDLPGLGPDAKELLALSIKQFEDMSGWNDVTRGSFSAEQSGRAILAIREQLERLFAPCVAAMARGHSEAAKIDCAYMRFFYDMPRMIGVEGHNRPDLARAISSQDFDGSVDVWIDWETMMPMPRALKLELIDKEFQLGAISVQERRRRMPFANVRNLSTPDDDQEASARRLVEQIRQTGAPPPWQPDFWVLDEAIHQDVLQRELLLSADTPPPIRQAAWMFWTALAQQAQMKQGIMPPNPQAGGGKPQAKGSGGSQQLGQASQSGGLQQPGMTGQSAVTDPQQAARRFEQTAPR